MLEKFKESYKSVESRLKSVDNLEKLEALRIEILGKKGLITQNYAALKDIEPALKKDFAKALNDAREEFEGFYNQKKAQLEREAIAQKLEKDRVDLSLFSAHKTSFSPKNGHPINQIMERMIDYFVAMNFNIKTGPLVEDDFHNFEALNLPKYHPARDMQDTFYFRDGALLRTHTSPVQIRTLESGEFPIRIIAPGSVFRRDYDLTHSPMFHQIEGLVVHEIHTDECQKEHQVNFANLKFILTDFLKHMFGDVRVRFRASFFPFTEPSAEADISCVFCGGEGCKVCSQTGWLEVLGCGVVNDALFAHTKNEHKKLAGYAFGMGVERFAMLLCRVGDLRSFFESDLRILEQF